MDTQAARSRLDELQTELEQQSVIVKTGGGGDSGELTSVDQHPADSASDVSEGDRQDASLEVVQAQLERVQAALARIDDGTYGRCVDCGKPIPDARLEAVPEAERDVEHQATYEVANGG